MTSAATPEVVALAAQRCRSGAPLLAGAQLAQWLPVLSGWEDAEGKLRKMFRFTDYYHTIAFVNAIAWMANQQDHHPDLSVHYDRVVIDWSTHDAGGVTLNDCICAARTEQLAP